MDRVAKHLDQWRHNRKFLATIPTDYPDWIVTVSFYTALHCVDALLAYDKVQGVISHAARNSVLMQTNRYLAIYRSFHPLYGLSRTVRYLADPGGWVPVEEIEVRILNGHLHRIEQSALKLMKTDIQPGKLTLMRSSTQDQAITAEVDA